MSKLLAGFVIYCKHFPNFCLIGVFSLEVDYRVNEDTFRLFPATKKGNLDKETDVGKFDIFCEMHFCLRIGIFRILKLS